MLPKILKDFNLFGDGNNWQGQIKSVSVPEIARKVMEYRGGGMPGAIEVDQGQEIITCEWNPGGLLPELFDTYGAPRHDAAMLRFVGSYETEDTGEILPVEIVMRGRHKTIGMGDAESGEDNEPSVTTTASYYKLTINGAVKIEYDAVRAIFIVNGDDRLAQRRSALGLA